MPSIKTFGELLDIGSYDRFANAVRSIRDNLLLIGCVVLVILAKLLVVYEAKYLVEQDIAVLTNPTYEADPLISALGSQWDASYFVQIAMNGYPATDEPNVLFAFAPVFPYTVALANTVVGDFYLAAILVSNVFYFLSLPAFYYVAKRYMERRAALLSTTLFAVFPTYLTYGTVAYTESMALFFAIVSWYFFEREYYALSSGLLAVAVLTRYIFLVVVPIYAILMVSRGLRRGEGAAHLRAFFNPRLLWLLIPLVSLYAVFSYFEYLTGDFFAVVASHRFFEDRLTTPVDQFTWFFTGFFVRINQVNPVEILLLRYIFTIPFGLLTVSLLRRNRELALYGILLMWITFSMSGISALASPRIMLSSWVTFNALGNDTPPLVYVLFIALAVVTGTWVMLMFLTTFFA